MFRWPKVGCLALIIVGLALWNAGQAITPARAAGKTVPKIAFALYDRKTNTDILSIADPDGKNVVSLFKDGHFFGPVWSPDGTQLAFEGSRVNFSSESEVYLVRSDGSNLRKISSHTSSRGPGRVTWSPDGTQLIYSVFAGDEISCYRINADGSGETKLSFKDLPYGLSSVWVAWSPDGKLVAVFGHRDASQLQIYLADENGENAKPLPVKLAVKSNISVRLEMAWSPDKQHIFVYETPNGSPDVPSQLYVANADGSNPKVILKSPKLPDVSALSVSPDGKRILFVSSAPDNYRQGALWVASADGSGLHALPLRDVSYGGTSWGLVPQDALPRGGPISFSEAVKRLPGG